MTLSSQNLLRLTSFMAIFFLSSCQEKEPLGDESRSEQLHSMDEEFDLPDEVSFNQHIRPIFNTNCTACHGGVKRAGDLSFIYRDSALGDTKSGLKAIVPGNVEESHLISRIITDDVDDIMPPAEHGPKLELRDVALIKKWIEQGADWEVHWAFEELKSPVVDSKISWGNGVIDNLVSTRWDEFGLEPSERAKPDELLRKISFDLTGLPPTISELDAFIEESEVDYDEAIERVVDKLLASPSYGEKWASMWMDLARYADSEGLGADRPRSVWPYRDWLIRAYDEDLPFDEFTRMQLAGDLKKSPSFDDRIATTFHRLTQANEEGGTNDEEFRVQAVIDRVNTTWETWQGQTFGCVQCHSHPYDSFEHEEYYKFMAFFNSTQDSDVSNHFPTLPVAATDEENAELEVLYNECQSIGNTVMEEGEAVNNSVKWSGIQNASLKVTGTKATLVESLDGQTISAGGNFVKNTRYTVTWKPASQLISALKLSMRPKDLMKAKQFGENGFILSHIVLKKVDSSGKKSPIKLTRIIPDRLTGEGAWHDSLNGENGNGWGAYATMYQNRHAVLMPSSPVRLAEGEKLELYMKFPRAYLSGGVLVPEHVVVRTSDSEAWVDFSSRYDELMSDYKTSYDTYSAIKSWQIPVMEELADNARRPTQMFLKGNWMNRGEIYEKPDLPANLNKPEKKEYLTRLDLANWLTADDNPLTARVAVNRLWHQLFGRGIVETLEDFGSSGIAPTHLELLDYLAYKYQFDYKWSQKSLLKEVLLSRTYQLSSLAKGKGREVDVSNQWYSYGARRRLSGESIRDMSLSISGLRSSKKFGPPVYPPLPPGVWKPFYVKDKWETPEKGEEDRYRRAIYTYWKRSIPYPTMLAFDAPSREVCSKRRLVSNTPIAALATLNDPAFVEFSAAFAESLLNTKYRSLREKFAEGYRRATSRKASEEIISELESLYIDAKKSYSSQMTDPVDEEKLNRMAMSLVTSSILNLDATLTK